MFRIFCTLLLTHGLILSLAPESTGAENKDVAVLLQGEAGSSSNRIEIHNQHGLVTTIPATQLFFLKDVKELSTENGLVCWGQDKNKEGMLVKIVKGTECSILPPGVKISSSQHLYKTRTDSFFLWHCCSHFVEAIRDGQYRQLPLLRTYYGVNACNSGRLDKKKEELVISNFASLTTITDGKNPGQIHYRTTVLRGEKAVTFDIPDFPEVRERPEGWRWGEGIEIRDLDQPNPTLWVDDAMTNSVRFISAGVSTPVQFSFNASSACSHMLSEGRFVSINRHDALNDHHSPCERVPITLLSFFDHQVTQLSFPQLKKASPLVCRDNTVYMLGENDDNSSQLFIIKDWQILTSLLIPSAYKTGYLWPEEQGFSLSLWMRDEKRGFSFDEIGTSQNLEITPENLKILGKSDSPFTLSPGILTFPNHGFLLNIHATKEKSTLRAEENGKMIFEHVDLSPKLPALDNPDRLHLWVQSDLGSGEIHWCKKSVEEPKEGSSLRTTVYTPVRTSSHEGALSLEVVGD